jgi:hypothetical protein
MDSILPLSFKRININKTLFSFLSETAHLLIKIVQLVHSGCVNAVTVSLTLSMQSTTAIRGNLFITLLRLRFRRIDNISFD